MCFIQYITITSRERFGLYHVNITDPALSRTAKLSADYFKQLIANRELPKDDKYKEPAVSPFNCLIKRAAQAFSYVQNMTKLPAKFSSGNVRGGK